MRIIELTLGCALLAFCMIQGSEAVACTSPDVPTGCTDCTDDLNADEPDCTTTTTTTTAATTTTTTTTVSSAATVRPVASGPKRKVVRITNLRYTNVRRIKVKKNGTPVTNRNQLQGNNARLVGVIVG